MKHTSQNKTKYRTRVNVNKINKLMLETSIAGPAKMEDSTELVLDWQKAKLEGLKQAIADINWLEEFGDKSGKECMDIVYRVLERETEKHVSCKLRREGQKPIWMNRNILRLIRKKKRLWRWYSTDGGKDFASFNAYREIQKEVKKAIKQEKKKFEKKLAKEAKKNAKQFHSYIKKKTANKVTVGPLKVDGNVVTDHQVISDMLNNLFCSVFTEEDLEEMPGVEQQYAGNDPLVDVTITRDKVRKKLAALKPSPSQSARCP